MLYKTAITKVDVNFPVSVIEHRAHLLVDEIKRNKEQLHGVIEELKLILGKLALQYYLLIV